MPVDWSRSHTRSLHLPVLNIEDRPVSWTLVSPSAVIHKTHSDLMRTETLFFLCCFRGWINWIWMCLMMKNWGNRWTCTPSLCPALTKSLSSLLSRCCLRCIVSDWSYRGFNCLSSPSKKMWAVAFGHCFVVVIIGLLFTICSYSSFFISALFYFIHSNDIEHQAI